MSHAVLFDLDGTLFDSLADLAEAGNAVLRARGFAEHPHDAYRYFVGDGIRILVRRILPPEHQQDEALIDQCLAEFRTQYGQAWNVHSHLYSGIPELLEELERRKVPMAIFSNKPHDFTVQCVRYYLPDVPFRIVWGVDQNRPRKPDPTGACQIAEQLQIPPEQWLYVGDTSIDMRTARGAGMFPVGVLWGFRDAQELRAAGAEILLDRPQQLLDVLDQRKAADHSS